MTAGESAADPIPVWIPDEWSELKSAVMRESGESEQNELFEAMSGMMDVDMLQQVTAALGKISPSLEDGGDRLARLLEERGVQLHFTKRTGDFSNNVWVRDILFGIRDRLFLAAPSFGRGHELNGIKHIRDRVANVVQISEGTLEGGDIIMPSNDLVLVGSRGRGADFLHQQLKEMGGIEMAHVPHKSTDSTPHLDCAIAPLPPIGSDKPNLLIREESLISPRETVESLQRYFHEIITADGDSPDSLSMNIFWINPETALSTPSAVETNKKLRRLGYEVIELEYGDLQEKYGSIRCSVAPLERTK